VKAASTLDLPVVEQLDPLLVEVRRHLHRHPEVGLEEHETSAFLRHLLAERGFVLKGPFGGTGFAIEIEGANPGPIIGYRTELDALATPDAKSVPYASAISGVAHLCGHDAHMAIAVGVALLLQQRRDEMHGTVRIIFQPNEENIPSGAPLMMSDGAIDDMKEIFCVHSDPTIDIGQFGLRSGAATAAAASWRVEVISGQAGHSARPHETIDTLWLANQILTTFYQLPGRVHDARRSAVLTACSLHGGDALNVIPSQVSIGGTLRSIDLEALRLLSSKMNDVVEHLGAFYRAEVRYEASLGVPAVINDPLLIKAVGDTILDVFGDDAIFRIPEPSMGGEDFAFYLQQIPGALVRLGTRGGPSTGYPLHHALFDIDERALVIGARLMTEVLVRRLAAD
jgi:amidohydrolase